MREKFESFTYDCGTIFYVTGYCGTIKRISVYQDTLLTVYCVHRRFSCFRKT